jgi:fluoride exporter
MRWSGALSPIWPNMLAHDGECGDSTSLHGSLGFPGLVDPGMDVMLRAFLPFLLVGAGSMAGGVSRYCMTLLTQGFSVFSLPYGTLISNTAGCLLIGVIAGISGKTELLSTEMRLLLATGFCGGFTTMSSFVYELGQMVQDKEFYYASSYFIATLAGAGLAFVVGLLISDLILG